MPIIKSAIKTLKQEKKHELVNRMIKSKVKSAIKSMQEKPSEDLLKKVFSSVDRAAKKNVFHPNRAARVKSQMAKLLTAKPATESSKSAAPKKKKTSKK